MIQGNGEISDLEDYWGCNLDRFVSVVIRMSDEGD